MGPPSSAKILLDSMSWARGQHDTVRPACVGSFELDRETWRESIEVLGFDRLLLLGLRSQLDWLRVAVESCKKTFVGMVCA
ncbi:hypothetical protein GW17_00059542 [Ensete ventricosum]|nr:hypothetical protein GW17_00059542 [Ensete ventricosum]